MRRPPSQHLFWTENLATIAAMLLTEVAFVVCTAVFWSLYAGAIAACLGGAVCMACVATNNRLHRILGDAPMIVGVFVGLCIITAGWMLALVGYGLIVHSAHAALKLAPFGLVGMALSALVWSGANLRSQPNPPDDPAG